VPRPARLTEVTVLLAASLAATALRFVLYRHWVSRRPGTGPAAQIPAGQGAAPLAIVPEPNGQHS
jgi:hypothetical protein